MESPISMTTGLRIRVKKPVMPEELSEHLVSEEHLKLKGRSRGWGRWKQDFRLAALEGSREERRNRK